MNQRIALQDLFYVCFMIGLTGFGPSVVSNARNRMVDTHAWISGQDFINGLALAQLLPGATYVSLIVYIGYRVRGMAGALTSFTAFLIPPFSLMLALSVLYFSFHDIPGLKTFFWGIQAAVIGLIAHAWIDIRKATVKNWQSALIAVGAAVLMFVYAQILALLPLAALAGILFFRHDFITQPGEIDHGIGVESVAPSSKIPRSSLLILTAISLGAIWLVLFSPPVLLEIGMVFFQMGTLVFGGGTSMIPFIQQQVVSSHGWLTQEEFMVGIALGQVTPGPVLITATFIGYKVAGFSGALVSTLGIFTPSLFLVTVTAEIHQKLKNSPWIKAAFQGITASFAGMIMVVLLGLAQHTIVDWPSALIALSTFAALRLARKISQI